MIWENTLENNNIRFKHNFKITIFNGEEYITPGLNKKWLKENYNKFIDYITHLSF